MAHNHSHGDCHDESNHHDHQHGLPEDIGHRDNLYARIDRANVVALNAEDPEMGPAVIKPWDQRLDEETVGNITQTHEEDTKRTHIFRWQYLESDADDQLYERSRLLGTSRVSLLLGRAGSSAFRSPAPSSCVQSS